MTKQTSLNFILAACCVLTLSARADDGKKQNTNWPSFRGPHASGVADGFPTATEWNVETGQNILWKTRIPGLGHSSPIVWADRIFVTTAESDHPDPLLRVGLYGESPDHPEEFEHRFRLYCLDKNSGSILWSNTAHTGIPKIKRHIKASHANCTPATDGRHVIAFFGSDGLYCYDFDGKLLWEKDLGLLDAGPFGEEWHELQWGFASSPVIHDGEVIIQSDTRSKKFLAAFDVSTGQEIWRTPRDDYPTFSTPTVVVSPERTQIVVNGYTHVGGYDFATGRELWKLSGGGDVPTPTPVAANGLVYITNAHGALAPIYAIRTDAVGDISLAGDATTNQHIPWCYKRRGNYMQTPLVYRGGLFCCRDNGALTCFDATTGEIEHRRRLGSGSTGFTASPVAADGKVYFSSEEGDVHVIQAQPDFKELAVNAMNEITMATPAISEGVLYFRTRSHLVAVGKR